MKHHGNRERTMVKISNRGEIKMAATLFIFLAAVIAVCMADLSYGQYTAAEELLGSVNRSGSFSPVVPAEPAAPELGRPVESGQLTQEMRRQLIAELKERLVKQVKDNWKHPSKVDDEIVEELGRAYKEGVLEPVIVGVLSDPRLARFFPAGAKMKPEEAARMLSLYIGAELESSGNVEGVQAVEQWDEMTARHLALVTGGNYAPRQKGQASLLRESGFMAELAALQRTPFSGGNTVRPLINGAASFAKRDQLMKSARRSIYLTTWAFYDDETGHHTADILIARKKEGLDVRLMIDKDTAGLYDKGILAEIEAAGIPLLRYQPKDKPYYEFHSKILIVDGKYAVLGGMNIGNEYSHLAGDQKWRDTDVFVQGPALKDAMRFFAAAWNAQAAEEGGRYTKVSASAFDASPAGSAEAAIIWNDPGQEPYILLSMLKAVYGATERINIENAIIVMLPSMKQALLDARARGVEVNILSNSRETIGDNIMSSMILGSFPELLKAGAGIYLKEGGLANRLHSKFMTVDGVYGTIGSFNLQPRSVRYVKEINVNFSGREAVSELDAAFGRDIAAARKAVKVKDLDIPVMPIKGLIHKLMFNQL